MIDFGSAEIAYDYFGRQHMPFRQSEFDAADGLMKVKKIHCSVRGSVNLSICPCYSRIGYLEG